MYKYDEQKKHIFTDKGQREFLKVRDRVDYLLKTAGDFRKIEAAGYTWEGLSYIARLEELGEIIQIYTPSTVLQHRIYIKGIK